MGDTDSNPSRQVPLAADHDPERAWREVRDELARALPAATFALWIEPLRAVGIDEGRLLVAGPERARCWVERRYRELIATVISTRLTGIERVAFVAEPPPPPSPGTGAGELTLNPSYTFDRFVIGAGNRFAHSAALNVAESPGEAYNPLFLHGPPGLGKTHLLVAIAHYAATHHPELRVRYTTAEAFTSEFVGAMRRQGGERFKARHREIGALLIDDVQFLEGKPGTEEEFFHTFNVLYEAGSQIVLSSDRPPAALERLAERLRDRFQWGLTVELCPPDLPTRLAVLRKLAAGGRELEGEETLHQIATRSGGNLRQLEGALTRVAAFSSLIGTAPTPAAVEEMLALPARDPTDRSGLPQPTDPPTLGAIVEAVGTAMHVSTADILSTRRTPDAVRARHLAIHLGRELTRSSVQEIARHFDRDHSTVLHALASIKRKLDAGTELDAALTRAGELLEVELRHPPRG